MTQTTLEARRDRYGRYFLTPSTGGEPSLTAASRPSLGRSTTASAWSGGGRRMLIGGLVARPDLFAAGASTRPDDKDVLDSICEQAVEAGGASAGGASAGATVGSALHRFLERIDAGEDVDVPPPWDADVAAYGKVLDAGRIGIIPELIERVVAIEGLREPIAGTFDRVVEAGGRRMVADLKTGQSMNHSWPSISIQLALYAHATSMVNLATGENEPMPSVDQRQGLVIHLPAGQGVCTLHTVNLVAGWRAASLALEVREWRARRDLATELEPSDLDLVALRRAWAVERIEYLRESHPGALASLARSWPVGVPTFKQSGDHDAAQLALVCTAIADAEREAEVEFPWIADPGTDAPKGRKKSANTGGDTNRPRRSP